MHSGWLRALGVIGTYISSAHAQRITLDPNSDDSFKNAAKIAAKNMMTYYNPNVPGGIPGILPPPYYWWEAGAMFGQLIHYWSLTGDTQYNDEVKEALLFQIGDEKNYMPSNQSKDLGNDDQTFWAFSAMDAAESGFSDPDSSYPSWVALAQAVWNTQIPRWETSTCNGGLRWQIYPFNAGYQYKNAISTGGLFQLSARLARYTGNQTYADWAEKAFDWIFNSPIMAKKLTQVFDGTAMANNCSDATNVFWTYNPGTMLVGSAYMYNFTNGNQTWLERVQGLVHATDVFFVQSVGGNVGAQPGQGGDIMAEVACETPKTQTCNYDQPSFKAYLSRWMAVTSQLCPEVASNITSRLHSSAIAAAVQCAGQGTNMCGRRWYQSVWDGFYGVGEQMSAMSIFQNNLIKNVAAPLTLSKGGTSQSDPTAGAGSGTGSLVTDPAMSSTITTGDKAGAGILTLLSVVLVISGTSWMIA